ncbi:murein hydrolase activator EnvC family protein [Acetonema longum]|uniref:Peptidase M23 n=1 Tax=Acetonema longum DSM 6540 TaxID=1009370 RepID=F7NNY4_9FIRM|nr:peptidoglycan DD-metalloendopeptidase family protein [Acetonema longum]EGO62318.1 Peptidase M23 [Acetonema longum DSM 6540]
MWEISRHQKAAAFALLLLNLPLVYGPAFANDVEQKQQELRQIQMQLQEQQSRALQAQRKVNSVSEKLRAVQTELDQARQEYGYINHRLRTLEEQTRADAEFLEKAEVELAERTKILSRRIRDIYKNGQVSYVDVLLGASDFRDFTTRYDLLRRVLDQDVALITQIKTQREQINSKQAQMEQDQAELLVLGQKASEKKSVIQMRRDEHQVVLNAAVNEKEVSERAYLELLETSREIESLIRRVQSDGQSADIQSSGSMLWPAVGPITSPFGWRTHPIFGTRRLHTGIDIGVGYGTPVIAVDSGIVIYADWMGGYGKTVIINHGGGLSTLYAHNSQLVVSEGQIVQKGSVVSKVGSTGNSTGPHLHFEVRKSGSPVSPIDYLP